MSKIDPPYTYRATVAKIVDGDTMDLDIDLGFKIVTRQRCRLAGLDTPERGQPGWSEATAYCNVHVPPGTHVLINSKPPLDKFGRYLVYVQYDTPEGIHTVNWGLIEAGLAVPYDGGPRG